MTQGPETSFGTFAKDALPERIADRLLSLIKEKQLRPGDRLPAERELAAMMQVSRPSLREALRALAIMNVIEIRQGSGTYVTSLDPGLLVEHLDFVFSLDDATFLELLDARKILEVGIAAMAAERITDEEVAQLEACFARSAASIQDRQEFLRADLELHERITQAARNPILGRFMAAVSRLGLASRSRTVDVPGMPEQSLRDHRDIVEALKARDPRASYQAMLEHLNNIEAALKKQTAPKGAGVVSTSEQPGLPTDAKPHV